MQPTRIVPALSRYVPRNQKKNNRHPRHPHVRHLVCQRKLQTTLSNRQLCYSLQYYIPTSSISATRSSHPITNNMPKSRSRNKWNMIKTTYHSPPRPLTFKSPCPMALWRTKRECPSLSCRYNKPKTLMSLH